MRPEFITEEDIIRWDDIIANDIWIQSWISEYPMILPIREVIYAGLWLSEALKNANCHPVLCFRIQEMAGRLSFANEPWHVAQTIFTDYKENNLEFEIDYYQ